MSHFTPAFKLVLRPSLYVPNILEFLNFLNSVKMSFARSFHTNFHQLLLTKHLPTIEG